jgi:hypothetical protein
MRQKQRMALALRNFVAAVERAPEHPPETMVVRMSFFFCFF